MIDTATPQELSRRKSLRLRLRRDLAVEAQKYEGRTFYVLKDPVSMRYYRLKDNEHYLLQFLDGDRTLEDAQKSYEKHFRPERLKLEDLEAFAQQLLTAGLAQNESPRAGKLLYDRRKKRIRSEWMQTLTNILYIKIPLIDPDRLLQHMLKHLSWIFSIWFFTLSVLAMASALLLVGTHFDTFRSKLPDYHEFFSFKTVVYLWGALAVVKVIHEFGHGLSCRHFGGEVHEMGALFLCFSPALYCNVSDAWTLPNKWHRIIISGAGIYVELLIATFATFIWWNATNHPFIQNMSLSLMVVCSVSTIVFNANPLMRYDGYYVLADWLEIPNLREKSNRFLTNLLLEHCLGVEVQPEPYMDLTRKLLFIAYAIISYVYRWLITFTILYFMYHWLAPYKLQVVSSMLAVASLASMLVWPVYRLIKNIYRRGRLPDMKRWRVVTTGTVVACLLYVFFMVDVPISRIRGTGIVEAVESTKVEINYTGQLKTLKVRDGDMVEKDDVLAEFTNLDAETNLRKALRDLDDAVMKRKVAEEQKRNAKKNEERDRYDRELSEADKLKDTAEADIARWKAVKQTIVLTAPISGKISNAPTRYDIGKGYEKGAPFCSICMPGKMRVTLPVETSDFNQLRANLMRKSNAAEAAWKLMDKRIAVDYQQQPIKAVLDDLGKNTGLHFDVEKGGSLNITRTVTFSTAGKQQPLDKVLDRIFFQMGLGYIIRSHEGKHDDGWLIVRETAERGTPLGEYVFNELPIELRINGRGGEVWKGKIERLPEKEAEKIPLPLSSRGGGPVAVKGGVKSNSLIPQTQQFLVEVQIEGNDQAVVPGAKAQVKIHCKNETCFRWAWRTINGLFDLPL